MQIVHDTCCGIDVHAKTAVACLIKQGRKQTLTFSTMTADLLRLLDWLVTEGCTIIAIESTGVYWRPVFNILEGSVEVMLVNARHVKAVPGRKTDVKDCEWLADLLRHGLLKPSFIPPIEIRELRELTRYRQSLIREQATVANRVQKIAESGNIKLSQVASDALGASGRQMLRALASGETDTEKMSQMARTRLRNKRAELKQALEGRLTRAQRWVLGELLNRYEELERGIEKANEEISREVESCRDPFVAEAVKLLDSIPGIGESVAQVIVSEMGVNMGQFASHKHLASWAGMCPGNNESAGKRKSGKTTKGSQYLRTALVQASWAATRTKETYLSAQYRRLVKRMGKNKALVAVGHTILVMIYHILSRRQSYQELGGDYLDRRNVEAQKARLIQKLEALGLRVTVEQRGVAA
jgi:transposase